MAMVMLGVSGGREGGHLGYACQRIVVSFLPY